MYEKRFLQDIADQNYTKYKVSSRSKSPVRVSVEWRDESWLESYQTTVKS